jgi:hypothetical protein
MGKIENEHQLEISRDWVTRFRRVLKGYKTADIPPDIRQMCVDSTHFTIEKIEREIEEYLAHKATEASPSEVQNQAASG